MTRSSLLLVAAVLTAFGAAVLSGHPPWGAVVAISIFLTAAAMAAGALTSKSSSADRSSAGQRIPASLVTLSATAILAVYAAGYQRTSDAAGEFEEQAARHQPAAPPSSNVELPKLVERVGTPAAPSLVVPHPAAPASVPSSNATPASPSKSAAAAPVSAAPAAPSASVDTEPAAEPAPSVAARLQAAYKDGTFSGWGRCRHGSIEAAVTITGGQIVGTEITQCLTRYSCSWIENLPGQVVTRQSSDVDYVSGATESTDAFYDAVTSALASARE